MPENKKSPKPKPGLKRTIDLPSPQETASVEGVIKRLLGSSLDFDQAKTSITLIDLKADLKTDHLGLDQLKSNDHAQKSPEIVKTDSISGLLDPRVSQTPGSQTPGPNNPPGLLDPGIYQKISSHELDAIGYVKLANTILDTLPAILDPYELVIYLRLYRLSYGFHQTSCLVGNTGLSRATSISDRQVRRSLLKLISLGLVKVIQVFNTKEKQGTLYEVYVPVKQTLGSVRPQSLLNPPVYLTSNKDDDHDDLKRQDHHQTHSTHITDHEKAVMMIYQEVTGNLWSKADHTNYEKIKNIPIDKIEVALKLANDRATNRPNSFAFFIKEIIASVNPKTQSRTTRKKAMQKIVERVRNASVGSNISPSDFVYKVKEACLREDVAFENDLFNEVMSKT